MFCQVGRASLSLFCCQPSAWKPHGKAGAAGPSQQSEQRAWGTTYPTGPRSQNPFFKRTRAESQRRPGQLAGTDGWRAVAPLWEQTRAPAQPGRQPEPQPQPGGWEPLGPLCPLSAGPVCPRRTGKTSRASAPLVLGPWGQVGPIWEQRGGGHEPWFTGFSARVFADALAPSVRGYFSGLEVPSVLLNTM